MTAAQAKRVERALNRCAELLDATERFMEENPIAAEYAVTYDEAECDGHCLAEDCKAASREALFALRDVKVTR